MVCSGIEPLLASSAMLLTEQTRVKVMRLWATGINFITYRQTDLPDMCDDV